MINTMFPFSYSALDYPDPEAFACIIFVLGCKNTCVDCQNPHFKNKYYTPGKDFTIKEILEHIVTYCERHKTNHIVLSGGDSLSPENIEDTKKLLHLLSSKYEVCVYTGYEIEYVKNNKVKGFKYIKCGCYDPTQKQLSEKTSEYIQFASANQELYDSHYNKLSNKGIFKFKQ